MVELAEERAGDGGEARGGTQKLSWKEATTYHTRPPRGGGADLWPGYRCLNDVF